VESARVVDLLKHVWLPAVVLGVAGTARLTRVMRANLLDELIVGLASNTAVFGRPRHPYTAALMRAAPAPDPRAPSSDVTLIGRVANPADPPLGCYFHPRCPFATDGCPTERPVLGEIVGGHLVRCHRAEELRLTGADVAEE
jgi:peptide/nickel transport system ATP-binding protein